MVTQSRVRALIWLVLTLAVVFGMVFFLFPLVFPLRIDVPATVQFGSASSMLFQISNENLTPLRNVEYSCEVSRVTLANGSAVHDAKVLSRGDFPSIGARRAVRGRCQTAYILTAPLRAAEYNLTVTYRPYPWRRRRTRVARISAQISNGQVPGWKLDGS